MLSYYTGGPASNLGMAMQFAGFCVQKIVCVYHTKCFEKEKPTRLKRLADERKLPDKRLHISGDHYVH